MQPELHLRPDKAAKYEIVAGVMASSQRLGLTKIGIVGSEQFVRSSPGARARSARAPSESTAMDFARQQRDPTKHMIGIAFVVLVHVIVIWALLTGLGAQGGGGRSRSR